MYKQKNYSQLLNEIESNSKIKSLIIKTEVSANDLCLYVDNQNIYDLLKLLRDSEDFLFSQLTDLCGVDWPENEIRFQVVYNLLSMSNNSRIRVKTYTDENDSVTSVSKLFPCAQWYEREAYDLFGINFKGNKKRIVYEPVELKQEYRSFDFESPWEGVKYPENDLESGSINDK